MNFATTVGLFLLIPGSYQVDEAEFNRFQKMFKIDPASIDLDQPSRLITQEFSARGLTVLDSTGTLRAATLSGNADLYGRIDNHFSAEGHEVVARYLTEFLAQRNNTNEILE